ncbi:Non-repetitive/WGA-negative nucleoporin C-terminal-domain-containing protein [Peziza echinospora]|nr:Non-repetitive/WGA-negative nucleoporin C-terminal-domain-containing protein [Peziza echinospora]
MTGGNQGSISTEHLAPIPRAAQRVNETYMSQQRYPDMDDIINHGTTQSLPCQIEMSAAWVPFKKTNSYHIPDSAFTQYNNMQCHTIMGLFTEIGTVWMTVDNRLYMWDYATGGQFQGYEEQPNPITCVKLLKPRSGVLKDNINYVLAIGTTVELILIGIQATKNIKQPAIWELTMYNTNMSVNTKGLDISIIEGTALGRIFFAGISDNDVYELTYQAKEGWFHGRCGKICHTSQGISSFAPKIPIPFLSKAEDVEYVKQLIIDETRSYVYTLSSRSNIRVFHYSQENTLAPRMTYPFTQLRDHIRINDHRLVIHATEIVSISPVPFGVARQTHLIATMSTGARVFLKALVSEYSYEGTSSMQMAHILPPPELNDLSPMGRRAPISQSNAMVKTIKAKVIAPGYFVCIFDPKLSGPRKTGEQTDSQEHSLFISSPDCGKIAYTVESGKNRIQFEEVGTRINLESRAEAIEVVTPPYTKGNETWAQFDTPAAEIAILTSSGVQIFKRRRLVEIFAAAIRYGAEGAEAEVRKFFITYGPIESCVTALAVACGVDVDSLENRGSRVTDQEVVDLARKYFIEFGGKPRADTIYDAATLPSLDNVKLSARHDAISIYVTRIIRSIWKENIIETIRGPGGMPTYTSKIEKPNLQAIQIQLQDLAKFLDANKSFIDGLSGSEQLLRVGSRVEEVAQQAEHRALHALMQLIGTMIEGIAFVLVLFDSRLDDIINSLSDQQRVEVRDITYEGLFTTDVDSPNSLAKSLVTAIVNYNIAQGSDVDTIAEALRKRCGSFCSSDDVISFKAIEALKKARDEEEFEVRAKHLRESLRLFQQTAASMSMVDLRETVEEFKRLKFYPGAVQLALVAAKEMDRGNQAMGYLNDGSLEHDPRATAYKKRQECYRLVFEALEEVDAFSSGSPDALDGMMTDEANIREDTWDVAKQSDDEVFLHAFYDWLFKRGQANLLLATDSRTALEYLQRRSVESLPHAELLWQFFARREDYFQAASVLCKLARGDFKLKLENRLEFLSRARGLCSSNGPVGMRQRMTDLSHQVQEELDVAVIQDEILKRIEGDERISKEKKAVLKKELDAQLISLSDLYNKFAEPYEYTDICLAIFQSADYRGPTEIRKCWETLINQVHEQTVKQEKIHPFEAVADTIRRLGHKFSLSEYIFPPNELVPLLETYALERQRDIGPPTWIMDSLLEAGVQPDILLRVLDDMYWRNEIPFQGSTKRRLVRDAVFVAEKWFYGSLKGARGVGGSGGSLSIGSGSGVGGAPSGFRSEFVVAILEGYLNNGLEVGPERQRLERLLGEIRRRM